MNFKEQYQNLDESISVDSKYNVSKGFSIDDIEYDGKMEDIAPSATQKNNNKKEYISFGIDKDELKKRLSGNEDLRGEYRNAFILKQEEEIEDQRQNVSWYLKISKWSIIFIILINIFVVIRENSNYFNNFIFLDYARFPIEISIFVILSYIVVQKRKQIPKIAGISCAIAGFVSGTIISFVELFVYRQMWSIFNLAVTTFFLGLIGLVIGLVFGAIFYQDNMILSINKKYEK